PSICLVSPAASAPGGLGALTRPRSQVSRAYSFALPIQQFFPFCRCFSGTLTGRIILLARSFLAALSWGRNWFRSANLRRWRRLVVDQKATLKSDHTNNC